MSPGGDKITNEIFDPATGKLLTRSEQGFRVDGTPLTSETTYTYTASGMLQTIDGPRAGTIDQIIYTYYSGGPSSGMLWKITEPNGAMATFQEYDGLGNLLRKTDVNGHDTTYTYNSRGSLLTQTTVDGTTQYEYDARGNISKITHPKGNSVSYTHSQSGLSQVTDATGRIEFGYTNGNKVSELVYDTANALNKSTIYDYDDKNRLWHTRQASGDFEEYLYDENGNLTYKRLYAAAAPTVPFKTTFQEYDFLNRLKTVSVAGDQYHVSYGYDVQGNLNTVTDPINQTTSYVYDDLGRQGRVVSPETGTTDYTHDEAGNITSRRDSLNRLISYEYDGLNRPTDITYSDATVPVHYRYDDYSAGSYPDAVGRLTEIADASGFRRLFYNAAGRVSKVVHTIDGRNFTTEYGYDANGNLISLTYPSGRIIQYAYDPITDRLQSVTSWKDGVPNLLASGITHRPFGPLTGFDYGNGTHLTKDYENLLYRLDSLAVTGPFGDLLPARSYDYDPAGNIHGITRNLPGGAEPHVFEYDPMDRLSSWTKPGYLQQLTYDANGNRQSLSDNGLPTNYSYDPVAKNILASSSGATTLVYDNDPVGNITGFGTKSLVYDISGRLNRMDDGGVPLSQYIYNIDGQRVKKTVASQVTYYEYDMSGLLLHEYRAGGDVSLDYVYLEGEPLAMLESNSTTGSSTVGSVAGANGSIAPSGAQTISYGQTAIFTVTPNVGYRASVTGCGGTLAGSTYTTGPITGDCTVQANFGHTVTVTAGANGNISPYGAQFFIDGQTATFTVTPDAGYRASVTGCGGTLAGSTFTTGPITSDCTVQANFGHAVTAVAGPNGTITPSGVQTIGYSQTATFTVTPNYSEGVYYIASVTGCNGTLVGSIYTTGPITSDCTVQANFGNRVNTSVVASGSISPSTQIVAKGQTAIFTVTPNEGYLIVSVTGCGGTLAGSTYTTGPINGYCVVQANFGHAVTSTAGPNGRIEPSGAQLVIHGQSTTVNVFVNTPGYHIASVTGCNGHMESWCTYRTGLITGDCTIQADFGHIVTATAGSNGTVSPSGAQFITDGQPVTFTVTPNAGYSASVTGCGGTLSGSTYTTGPITGDCTVQAVFGHIVTAMAGPNGSISPSGVQLFTDGQTATFTVTPNTGYFIASVTGCGGTLAGSTYTTGPITGDCTVQANFDKIISTLSVYDYYSQAVLGGTVTSSPSGIDCGSICSATYEGYASVTLSQTTNPGYVFRGWSRCGGTGHCTVNFATDTQVAVYYDQIIKLSEPNGGGTWRKNTNYQIVWRYLSSPYPGDMVKIELLKGGVVNRTITSKASMGIDSWGYYWWKVPNNQTVGSDYQIRVTSTSQSTYTDTSDAYFTIQ